MAKIKLDIDEKNLSTVLNILENLKQGLVKNIEIDKKESSKPISSSIKNDMGSRYLSKEKYKQKLQRRVLEDDFLPKTTASSGRYLSPAEFKKRLKGS